jgi:methylmalonyl-CoA mutase C-terminal domain/subunit
LELSFARPKIIQTESSIVEAVMNNERPPIRILVAKPGLDGHDRGAKIIARALRNAGMEVIYTGIRQTPQMIAAAADQEDVDAIGLSILSGAHLELLPAVITALRARGLENVPVIAGGIIPQPDVEILKEAGIAEIFGPGTPTQTIIDYITLKVGAP